MIPKTIHCIWLGGPKTKLARLCRASWEAFAPDWTIREWTLSPAADGWKATVDGRELARILPPPYVAEALVRRKWAFAADWLRFWALEREGGVYFDFDVELVRPLSSALSDLGLADAEWCAKEWLKDGTQGFAPGAGLALRPHGESARRMLAVYARAVFDGNTTVGDLMGMNGVCPQGVPPDVFCPFDHHHRSLRTARTLGVHHYALSWITPRRRIAKWLNWHGLGCVTEALLTVRNVLTGRRT